MNRIVERMMQRYIPKVTVIGGAFIGLLTLIASLLGGDAGWRRRDGIAAHGQHHVQAVEDNRQPADDGDAPDDEKLIREGMKNSIIKINKLYD